MVFNNNEMKLKKHHPLSAHPLSFLSLSLPTLSLSHLRNATRSSTSPTGASEAPDASHTPCETAHTRDARLSREERPCSLPNYFLSFLMSSSSRAAAPTDSRA